MNISPVSFGKIVQVRGSRPIAKTIMNYANSPTSHNCDKKFRKEVKAVFDDSKKAGVDIWEQPDGSLYIFSGKESETLQKYISTRDNQNYEAWAEFGDGDMLELMGSVNAQVCVDKVQELIDKKAEPYQLTIVNLPKNGLHLFKIC